MTLKNKMSNEVYFIDLFEKWWHYPLLGLTWFLPHKAYKISVKNNSKPNKFKFSIGMGIAMILGFIINDVLQKVNFIRLSSEYYWVGRVFAFFLLIISLVLFWKYMKHQVEKGKGVNFEKSYNIQLKIFSFNTIRKSAFRILMSIISINLLATSIEYNLYGMLITMFLSIVVILSSTIILGTEVEIISLDGDKLITK